MALSWFQNYLERCRIRRNGNRRVLDERFGDLAITAPMAGGWNQLPISTTTSGDRAFKDHEHDSRRSGSKTWTACCFSDSEDEKVTASSNPQPSFSQQEKESSTANPPARSSDPPAFVYKPASEEFLKQMADIGKPKSPLSITSSNDSEKHKRQLSTISSNSSFMDPVLSSDIPRHQSYHSQPLTSSSSSSSNTPVGSRSPSGTLVSSFDGRPFQTSPALSSMNTPNTLKQNSPRSLYSDAEKAPLGPVKEHRSIPVPPIQIQPPVTTKSKKSLKKTRVVTEELVPSDTELFG
ncbi:hypothetical protein PAAG_03195 [Paracoccidioides lutzii Pb01]|uniref:Uncharacterized protein n=1 Tax=Paracoccidioides lutzii (strain ATCC MYA-826 / Pb01) TaxID=502779 RepID=C1GYP1_PARBA|nr:hypothetical protein PAAG_03195 [Paracoccidioides lutzii Pb01]EEH41632.1 hypothetical protein PAAG_03195 [Paracoccidioides lutzii Pb01]